MTECGEDNQEQDEVRPSPDGCEKGGNQGVEKCVKTGINGKKLYAEQVD